MAWPNFSVSDLYTTLISNLNSRLQDVGKLYNGVSTAGQEFANQIKFNPINKRLEKWSGSVWADLGLDVPTVAGKAPNTGVVASTIVVRATTGWIPQITRGALVYNNTTFGGGVPWSTESYDTDSIHDTSTNPHRLTVPVGVTKVRVSARIRSGYAGSQSIYIYKNGAIDYVGCPMGLGIVNGQVAELITPVLSVAAGDYFEVWATQSVVADATGSYNWFAMDILA